MPRTEPASRWESPERGDLEDSDSDDSDDDSSEYSDDEGDDEKDARQGDGAAEVERDFVKRARSASIGGDDDDQEDIHPARPPQRLGKQTASAPGEFDETGVF